MDAVDRRRLIVGSTLAGIGASTAAWRPIGTSAGLVSVQTGNEGAFAAEVDAGLAYFRVRAEEQVPLVEALAEALAAGDPAAARTAYVAARPPYEEIEVLAASFPQTDADVDARPYAIEGGETSEEYRGFHRIEGLLYRDEDLEAALPYAETLVRSARTLVADLDARANFTAALHFEGMIALANEVASKKISSEEETWSDQSLLIFRHNWIGIFSQFEPFVPAVEARDATVARAVAEAHEAALALIDPYFAADEVEAVPYSTVPPAERGRIVRASYRLRDALADAAAVLEVG